MEIQTSQQTKVWDPLVRTIHWLLVLTFVIEFATEDDLLTLHVWAGYLMGVAIIVRVLWGFVGTQHARFTDFVTTPREAFQYAKETFMLRAKRYLGHNPAGGLMIIVMMVSLVLTIITGIAVYGAGEHAGPMASWFATRGDRWEDFFEEIHEFFANFTLLLVVIHIGGVVIESVIHKENLVRSMFNGLKRVN